MRRPLPFPGALLVSLPLLAACQAAAPTPASSPPSEVAPATPALPFDQPQAAESTNDANVFTVVLGPNGAIRIDGQVVPSDEEVRALAKRAREQVPDVRAIIQADGLTLWRSVLRTMDLLKQAGIEQVAFGVAKQEQTSGNMPPPPANPGNNVWDCKFPAASDAAGIDDAIVVLMVAVAANGSPEWVQIVSDPGHGFGMVAAQCAMARTYSPARDNQGRPMAAKTPPIRVRFVR